MPGYGDHCATARAAEILATRWTPLVVRNLLMGCRTFTEIRDGLPGISPTVLTERLRMLERVGVLDRGIGASGHVVYDLTPTGLGLSEVVRAMSEWAERWLEPAPANYSAPMVLWKLSHLLGEDDLPPGRVVVHFDIRDDDRQHYWLLLHRPHREVCDRSPGAPDDVVVTTTGEWLTKWFAGHLSLAEAQRAGRIAVLATPPLERLLEGWGGLGSWLESPPEDSLLSAGAAVPTAAM